MNSMLTIRIEDDLKKLLEEASARSGRSKSDIVRQALKQQLLVVPFKQLQNELLLYGETRGWLTDKDIFREVT